MQCPQTGYARLRVTNLGNSVLQDIELFVGNVLLCGRGSTVLSQPQHMIVAEKPETSMLHVRLVIRRQRVVRVRLPEIATCTKPSKP